MVVFSLTLGTRHSQELGCWLAGSPGLGHPPPLPPMVREPVNHKPSQSNASYLGEGAPPAPAGTLVTQRSNGHPGLGCSFLVPGSSALPLVWWLPTAPTQSYLLPMPHRPHGHSSLASGTEEQQPAGSVPGQLSQQVPHTFSVSPRPVLTPPV